jgi:GTP cyclohydrolase I
MDTMHTQLGKWIGHYLKNLNEVNSSALLRSDNVGLVMVKAIALYALCGHHLQAFIGNGYLIYRP